MRLIAALALAAVGGVLPAATAQHFLQRLGGSDLYSGLRRTLRSDPVLHDEDADGDADLVMAVDLAEDDAASLSMSMGAATEFFMAAKAGKADGGQPAPQPPAPAKAAKADDETAARAEKSGKSDLSFSMSVPSKSGKSKSSKTQAPTPCVNPEVPSTKSSKSKSGKSELSFSMSLPSGKGGKSGSEGSEGKSGKSELSFSMSLPSGKGGKSGSEGKSGKSELSFSLPSKSGKSKSSKSTKSSKSIIPCLTDAPTNSPTTSPTDSPTKNPTESPTKNPTESPTKNPTESPTKNPTESPTKNPTESPTKNPTESPTKNPTESPTKNPTESPTKNPTESPTKNPTESPTKNPTESPTKNPTESPTKNPTESPTKNPTESPTKNPTESPTKNPTESPTKNPTESPTKNPTASPTKNPTESPTKNPTESPTKNPTESPTKNPTESPTKNPTASPTKNPTFFADDLCSVINNDEDNDNCEPNEGPSSKYICCTNSAGEKPQLKCVGADSEGGCNSCNPGPASNDCCMAELSGVMCGDEEFNTTDVPVCCKTESGSGSTGFKCVASQGFCPTSKATDYTLEGEGCLEDGANFTTDDINGGCVDKDPPAYGSITISEDPADSQAIQGTLSTYEDSDLVPRRDEDLYRFTVPAANAPINLTVTIETSFPATVEIVNATNFDETDCGGQLDIEATATTTGVPPDNKQGESVTNLPEGEYAVRVKFDDSVIDYGEYPCVNSTTELPNDYIVALCKGITTLCQYGF